MSEDKAEKKVLIDSDWKAEAQREKERLADEESRQAPRSAERPAFASLVNLLAMQAMVGLGGMRTPTGETIPPDPQLAQIYIDMLDILEQKTAGNLTEDEKKMLSATLYELRMAYVHAVGGPPPAAPGPQ